MKTLVEVTIEKDEPDEEGNPLYETSNYWLHHWGLESRNIALEDGAIGVANWTVAICEDYKTGQVETFLPRQIRILGKEIKP